MKRMAQIHMQFLLLIGIEWYRFPARTTWNGDEHAKHEHKELHTG